MGFRVAGVRWIVGTNLCFLSYDFLVSVESVDGNATILSRVSSSIDAEMSLGRRHQSCVSVLRGRFVVVLLSTILARTICWGLVPVTFRDRVHVMFYMHLGGLLVLWYVATRAFWHVILALLFII